MLSQRQRQTICRMTPSTVVSRRQPVMLGTPSTTSYVTYEGYGPGGIAVIVDALTDNKNRTASNVRKCISPKGNGSIGTQGCVSYMFDQKGQIIIDT